MIFLAIGQDHGTWFPRDQVLTSAGAEYLLLELDDVDHDTRAIARLKDHGIFYDSVFIMGSPKEQYVGSGLMSVVRPATPAPSRHKTLYAGPKYLVGLSEDTTAYLVYDLSRDRYCTEAEINGLSPFLLIDDSAPIYAPDEADIIKVLQNPDKVVRPAKEALTADLTHPNPAVRQSAAHILQAMPP